MTDLRTREGREKEIIDRINEHGGFSILWVTDNQKRAVAADRLIARNVIIRQKDAYPWCSYIISDVKND